MLQPLAEYFMLQTFVLSGGDRFVNLVQWLGMAGSIICVSCIARLWGASVRGQVLAALFCATLPHGILEESGAKNDYLLAFWLCTMTYFATTYLRSERRKDLWYCCASLGLSLLTKGTAYLYVPGMLLAVFLRSVGFLGRRRLVGCALVLCASALWIDALQYARNLDLRI